VHLCNGWTCLINLRRQKEKLKLIILRNTWIRSRAVVLIRSVIQINFIVIFSCEFTLDDSHLDKQVCYDDADLWWIATTRSCVLHSRVAETAVWWRSLSGGAMKRGGARRHTLWYRYGRQEKFNIQHHRTAWHARRRGHMRPPTSFFSRLIDVKVMSAVLTQDASDETSLLFTIMQQQLLLQLTC